MSNVLTSHVRDYYQTVLFVGFKQIADLDLSLRSEDLSYVTSIHASSYKYDLEYQFIILSLTIHLVVSAKEVSALSTGGMTFGHWAVNTSMNILSLDGCQLLEAIGLLHLKAQLGSIPKYT